MRAAFTLALLALCGGCAVIDAFSSSGGEARDGGPADGATTGCVTPPCRQLIVDVSAAPPTRSLDLLFVIDDSDSMKEEQDGLVNAMPRFIDALAAVPGGLPDLHIGVVSTDLGIGGWTTESCSAAGDDGLLQNTPRTGGCQAPRDRYISDVANGGGRDRNYNGALADTFACIAKLGVLGCGIEQPLAAMKRALDRSQALNAGFLRPQSFLAVIILSDEDDCSAHQADLVFDPSAQYNNISSTYGPFASYRCTEFGVKCDGANLPRKAGSYTSCTSRDDSYLYGPKLYADFLRSVAPPAQIFVGVIAGNPAPFAVELTENNGTPRLAHSCTTAHGNADPAIRLRDFAAEFPTQSAFTSICAESLVPPIEELGRQLSALMSGSCLYGLLLDAQPAAGLQPDCQVFQHAASGGSRVAIPPCASSGQGTTCYELVTDAANCPFSPAQLRLVVRRGDVPPAGTRYAVECFRP